MTTRADLRRRVGNNLGGLFPTRPTVDDADTLSYPGDQVSGTVGSFVYYKDQVCRVYTADANGLAGTLSLSESLTDTIANDEVELWKQQWHPMVINSFINDAISEAVQRVYDLKTPIYQCVSPVNKNLAIAADVTMVQEVEARTSADFRSIYQNSQWKTDDSDVTFEVDSHDYRYPPATRVDTPSGLNPATVYAKVGEMNLSGMDRLEGWFKSVAALTLTLRLNHGDTNRASLDVELAANTWTYIREDMPNQHLLRDIDRVEVSIPAESATVWLNGLWAVQESSIQWEPMPRKMWVLHGSSGRVEIQLESLAWILSPPQAVVRMITGIDPVSLDDDDDATNVEPWFVVARATELAYASVSGGRETDPEEYRRQSLNWAGRAELARGGFQPLVNIRRLPGRA